jgi:4-hydroxy-tetrahydrodipicolinate synthase
MFKGAYTAIVTPFTKDGLVDYEKLRELIEIQIEGGVSGIVPVGTTGESPTLNVEEHHKVIAETVAAVAGRVLVIAGTGGNSTEEAIELTGKAIEAGADATLQVTPYYNKPNQEGLKRHFAAVADLGLPVVLYNVPGRTSCEIAIDTIVELAEHPHVVAVKEAGGSVDRVSHIARRCGLDILSGDDALTFPMMAVGASGVISVASNAAPREVSGLVAKVLAGDWAGAAAEHKRLHKFFCDLFVDTNPIPIKAALALMGRIEEVYRLPLCPLAEAKREVLAATMLELGLI